MSSEDLKFIKTLKECGYEGPLDPTVFRSVPKHLMKWLSENINSSVLLTPDELTRLEDLETKNLLASGSSEVNSSGFSCSRRWSSESSPSLSGTDDSDILLNKDISEDVCGDDSGDDDYDDDEEIRYLRREIRAEDERSVMLRQLKDSLMKKLEKVTEEVQAEEKMKEHVMQKMGASTDKLCSLYKDTSCAYEEMVQRAQQASEVLDSRDCAEKKFLHQVIGETLEENFKKFLINVEKFIGKQKREAVVPVGEGEKFLFDSAPAEVTENLDMQRVNILTKELCNLVPRIADLCKRQLEAECAAFALPAAEKLLTDVQTGKYNISLEQLESKSEELRKDVAKLEVEVEKLSQSAACAVQRQAQAQVLPFLLSSAEELIRNFSAKQRAQEKFSVCMESYLCALILLRSVLACQSDTIDHLTSFIRDTHQYVTSKHSQALARMDTMHKLQEEHRHDQVQTVANNVLLKTFQKLLLGEEEPCCATVDSVFDLMSASLNQLKAQKDQAYEEHYSSLVDSNIATVLENKKVVDSLCNYLLLDESSTGFPSALLNFNDQFAVARTAIENFVKKKEQFKSSYDAKCSKINQTSQLRKELLEWVKFVTHGKHSQDETFAESSASEQSVYEEAGK